MIATIITIILVVMAAIIAWKVFQSLIKVLMTVVMVLLIIGAFFGYFLYQDYKTVKEFREDKVVYYVVNGTNYGFMKDGTLAEVVDPVEPCIYVNSTGEDFPFDATSLNIVNGLRDGSVRFSPELYISKFTGTYPNMVVVWFKEKSQIIEQEQVVGEGDGQETAGEDS